MKRADPISHDLHTQVQETTHSNPRIRASDCAGRDLHRCPIFRCVCPAALRPYRVPLCVSISPRYVCVSSERNSKLCGHDPIRMNRTQEYSKLRTRTHMPLRLTALAVIFTGAPRVEVVLMSRVHCGCVSIIAILPLLFGFSLFLRG